VYRSDAHYFATRVRQVSKSAHAHEAFNLRQIRES
jgi:hypothetical protein